MKLTIAVILAGALSLFFITTTLPPYDFSNIFFRLFVIFTILAILLGICLLPWLKGSYSDKWTFAMGLGALIAFSVFDLGYLTFALSTLI